MMASACVTSVGMSPENFLDCPSCPPYGWLSPRISFSREILDDGPNTTSQASPGENPTEKPDLDASGKDLTDFEFCLDNPVTMLPADELFSDGKLVPLQLAPSRPLASTRSLRSPEPVKSSSSSPSAAVELSAPDQYVFSPKAPSCSSRWRELLGLKKIQSPKPELQKSASVPTKTPHHVRSLKHFLHRSSKSASIDSALSLPLLRDSDSESVSISARLSLSSSSSSGPDHEDLPRLSLDADKPVSGALTKNPARIRISRSRGGPDSAPARVGRSPMRRSAMAPEAARRAGRSPMRRAPESSAVPARGVSVDSPRMNSSGKIVFQSLERSSSSPSSFNGGSRSGKIRGMERSYSANIRIPPVLNVPVCSLRGSSKGASVFGFGQLFSPQKRGATSGPASAARSHHRSRTDHI